MQESIARFLKYVSVNPETGCWEWTGAMDPSGYGAFKYQGKKVNAHRWIYQQHRGALTRWEWVDHLCRVRKCVNVVHLEAVTPKVNAERGDASGPRVTSCIHGHAYTESNTYRYPDGERECRTCKYYGGRLDPIQPASS
jgi:hypothetical protein